MDRMLKRWEIALLFGVLFALLAGAWLGQEQELLSEQVVRLHVIANSDTDRDQAIKLAVRDSILKQAETLYPSSITRGEALEILARHLPELEQAGQNAADEWGESVDVTAKLERWEHLHWV